MSQSEQTSHIQKSMELLITAFHTHSGKEGDKYKLNRAELKSLLKEEFGHVVNSCNDPKVVDGIMSGLDENQDGEVDFQEFVVLVAALTVACNEFFEDSCKAK